jgi:sugar-specific transcriptional regulator TrmB
MFSAGLGFTPREFKVALSISLKGLNNPTEIADSASISRSKIYEVLQDLG